MGCADLAYHQGSGILAQSAAHELYISINLLLVTFCGEHLELFVNPALLQSSDTLAINHNPPFHITFCTYLFLFLLSSLLTGYEAGKFHKLHQSQSSISHHFLYISVPLSPIITSYRLRSWQLPQITSSRKHPLTRNT